MFVSKGRECVCVCARGCVWARVSVCLFVCVSVSDGILDVIDRACEACATVDVMH